MKPTKKELIRLLKQGNRSEDLNLYLRTNIIDLIGADLIGADLTRANLTEADIRGANLRGADLIYMHLDLLDVYIQPEYTRIGYQYHKNIDWLSFDDDRISKMHLNSLSWWKKYKSLIELAIKTLQEGTK